MSKIIKINDEFGKPHYYDFGTKNSSFLLTAKELKELGIKNFYFMLEVKNPHLGVQDIDPYKEDISADEIGRIHIECKMNPWFFFREVAQVPVRGAGNYQTILTRASCAAVWCFMHSIDFLLNQPRQTYKSTWMTLIVEYALIYEFQNVEIPYMHIRQERCLENAEMLRDYICALPKYMNPWYGRNKLPGTKSLKYEEHNTSITILSSADSSVKAKDKLRGMTLFLCFLDEWEYIPYIASVLEGGTPAIISGREIVAQTGGRSCMMLASTPGDLETTTGKEAQRIIDQTPLFDEHLYDFTAEDLKNYFDGVTTPDEYGNPQQITMLYIEFHWWQLRKTEEWKREQYREAVRLNKLAEYRRGILLQRFRGGNGSFFAEESMEYIKEHVREPDHEIFILKKYHLYVYKHNITVPDLNSDTPYFDLSIPYLIGVDCATGKDNDNTAFVITHPYTLEVVGEMFSPWMGALDLMRTVTILAKMLPRALFCLESNMTGVDIIDFVQETQLENRVYHDDRAAELTKNVTNPHLNTDMQMQSRARAKKYFGTYVTQPVRAIMMNILRDTIKDYRHLIYTKYLVKDITNLVQNKNGKIAADEGTHDDIVMAYMHTLYILKYGHDLGRFGIDKNRCTYSKNNEIMQEYENSLIEDRIDNTAGLQSGSFEAQILEETSNSLRETFGTRDKNQYDDLGLTPAQYNKYGGLQETPVLQSTAGALAAFYDINAIMQS